MDNLLKQTRPARASRQNKEEPGNSSRDRRLSLQTAPSFKEKKKPESWLRRQFSSKTKNEDSNAYDLETAVAAAVFAVHSQQQEASFTKTKSQKEDTSPTMSPQSIKISISRQFSDLMRSTEDPDEKRSVGPTSSMKKSSSSADKKLAISSKIKSKISAPKPGTGPTEIKRQPSTRPGVAQTDADDWEKAELNKIAKRHAKINESILSWENMKKLKARNKLNRKEDKLAKKREKALIEFNKDTDHIGKIAEKSRAKEENRRRNEVLKLKEKANKMRKTGEVPVTCFCL